MLSSFFRQDETELSVNLVDQTFALKTLEPQGLVHFPLRGNLLTNSIDGLAAGRPLQSSSRRLGLDPKEFCTNDPTFHGKP